MIIEGITKGTNRWAFSLHASRLFLGTGFLSFYCFYPFFPPNFFLVQYGFRLGLGWYSFFSSFVTVFFFLSSFPLFLGLVNAPICRYISILSLHLFLLFLCTPHTHIHTHSKLRISSAFSVLCCVRRHLSCDGIYICIIKGLFFLSFFLSLFRFLFLALSGKKTCNWRNNDCLISNYIKKKLTHRM